MKLIILTCLVAAACSMPQSQSQLYKNHLKNLLGVRDSERRTNSFPEQLTDLKNEFDVTLRPVPAPGPINVAKVAPSRPPSEWELEQNRNAHYQFSTNIDDKISDQTQQRTEVRDGLKVEGSYSYSDGFFMRTYHYIADDKGYRIVSEEVTPLLDGPKVNLEGTASVDAAAHGTQYSYRVQSVPAVGQKIIEDF